MKLGHDLHAASTVIVLGLPYSFMSLDQFLARVHCLSSPKPVSVYVVIPNGSLAMDKWELLKDKSGASDLAFDGELSVQPEEAIDWNEVLRNMKARGIRAAGNEVPEAEVEAAWRDVAPLRPVFAPRKIRNRPPGSPACSPARSRSTASPRSSTSPPKSVGDQAPDGRPFRAFGAI